MSDTELEQESALPKEAPAETPTPSPEESIFPLYTDPQVEAGLDASEEQVSASASSVELPFEVPALPPEPPKRDKKKTLCIAAIVLAAVAVLGVAAAFAVPVLLQAVNPKAYLAACLAKTMGTYSSGDDAAAVFAGMGKEPTCMDFYFQMSVPAAGSVGDGALNETYGLDAPLHDLRYAAILEMDYPNRRADAELTLSYMGNAMSLLAVASDNLISFGSDSLTGGDFYCINTETLGADVAGSPVFSESFELDPSYGFNLFDAAPTKGRPTLDPGTAALLAQFGDELNKAVTVEKSGLSTVTVLGRESSSTRYVMTIPAEALHSFVVQSLRALTEDKAFLATTDFTDDAAEEFMDNMDRFFSSIQDAVTIEFYLADGRVVLIDAEVLTAQRGEPVTSTLVVEFDKDATALNATLTNGSPGSDEPSGLTLSYTRDGEAFHLTVADLTDPSLAALDITGSFDADKAAKTLSLDFSEISLTSMEETMTLGLGLSLAPLDAFSHELPANPTPLLEMEQDEFYALLIQVLSGASPVLYGDVGYS